MHGTGQELFRTMEMVMALRPDQLRRIDETLIQWMNRLREERGNFHVVWREDHSGNPYPHQARQSQPAMDFTR